MTNNDSVQPEFVLLADRPKAVPLVAKWWLDEWGDDRPGTSVESVCDEIRAKLNRNELPLQVLAVCEGTVVGVAVLKLHEMKDVFPERENWLGSLVVSPDWRGRGIGAALVAKIEELAASRAIEMLHLQTERLDGGLYACLGWKPLDRLLYRGHEVLVMEKRIHSNPVNCPCPKHDA